MKASIVLGFLEKPYFRNFVAQGKSRNLFYARLIEKPELNECQVNIIVNVMSIRVVGFTANQNCYCTSKLIFHSLKALRYGTLTKYGTCLRVISKK